MKRRILSMILAIAMMMSLFAGVAVTGSAAEGTYVFAQSVSVGDIVIMASKDGTSVFTGVKSDNTGLRADASPDGDVLVSADAATLTVEAGVAEGSIALKMEDGKYLGWTSGNKLYALDAVEEASSWTYTVADGKATLSCVKLDDTKVRNLQYNSGSPRFCAYTSNQSGGIALYVLSEGDICLHKDATAETTVPPTCTEEGVMTYTCSCGETWTEAIKALGHSYDAGTVVSAPTCTAEGTILYTCAQCGEEKEEAVPMASHTMEEGVCTLCGFTQAPASYFKAIDLDTVTEGRYLIGAVRGGAYPDVYIATSKIASGDIVTTDNYVTVVDGFICSTDLDETAQILTFTGNNTDGFTISYEENGETLYLGVSDYANNRKLAWSADYAEVLWFVGAAEKGGYYLFTAIPDSDIWYTVSQNSTGTSPIRGYKSGTVYTGIYLFVDADHCSHENSTEIPATEATCTVNGNTAGSVCNDCGFVEGCESIPAPGHKYEVSVSEGMFIRTCSVCGNVQEIPLNTIAEAKAYTDETTVYTVKGVVTYVCGQNLYIQDETGGMCVYFDLNAGSAIPAPGDEVVIRAQMSTDCGMAVMSGVTTYLVRSSGNELPLQTVTLSDLNADATMVGQRVRLENLTVSTIGSDGAITLTDAEGNTVTLYNDGKVETGLKANDVIDIIVIASYRDAYSLLLNPGTADEDITLKYFPINGLRISHNLNLSSDIVLNYVIRADLLEGFDDAYVVCKVPEYVGNELVGYTTVTLEAELRGSYYYFALNNLVAFEMNNMIDATLYVVRNGDAVAVMTDVYSIATYANIQIGLANTSENLKRLCANLLQYGAKAQLWKNYRTDALVDETLSEEGRSYLVDPETVTFSDNKKYLGDLADPQITFVGTTMTMDSKIVVRYVIQTGNYSGAPEDLSLRITYVDLYGDEITAVLTDLKEYDAARGRYAFDFDGLLAAELRTVMSVAVYAGEERVSETMEYSVDTYGNGKTGSLLTVVQAMIAYSDSAKDFFAA